MAKTAGYCLYTLASYFGIADKNSARYHQCLNFLMSECQHSADSFLNPKYQLSSLSVRLTG
jgi:hypothetical protein